LVLGCGAPDIAGDLGRESAASFGAASLAGLSDTRGANNHRGEPDELHVRQVRWWRDLSECHAEGRGEYQRFRNFRVGFATDHDQDQRELARNAFGRNRPDADTRAITKTFLHAD